MEYCQKYNLETICNNRNNNKIVMQYRGLSKKNCAKLTTYNNFPTLFQTKVKSRGSLLDTVDSALCLDPQKYLRKNKVVGDFIKQLGRAPATCQLGPNNYYRVPGPEKGTVSSRESH